MRKIAAQNSITLKVSIPCEVFLTIPIVLKRYSTDRGDHFKVVGLENLTSTKKH